MAQIEVVVSDNGQIEVNGAEQQGPAGPIVPLAGLLDANPATTPTPGHLLIGEAYGDGQSRWTNALLTPALAGADNASNLSTGTVPLGRLAGITNAQLSATAGILSSQIAELDASKITGTFPLSLMNQGTTGQFLRGDGAYSNTLTGGLTLGGHIIGSATGIAIAPSSTLGADNAYAALYGGPGNSLARGGAVVARGLNSSNPGGVDIYASTTAGNNRIYSPDQTKYLLVNNTGVSVVGGSTASFSGAVTTGALTVTGAITQTNSIGTVLGQLGNTGQNCFSGGSVYTAANGATLWMFGASHATFPGQAQFYPGTNVGGSLNFYDRALLRQLIVNQSGLTLQNQCRIIYGSSGTTTSANNETVGAVGGLRYNVASGLSHTLLVANASVLTANSSGVTSEVDLGLNKSSGNGYFTMRASSNFVYFQDLAGASQGFFQQAGAAMYYTFDSHVFRSQAGTTRATVGSTGLVLADQCRINYGAAGTTTAANNETVGTSTGPVTNAPSGSTVRTAIAGTTITTTSSTGIAVTTGNSTSNLSLVAGTGQLIMGSSSIPDCWGFILNARNDGRILINGGTTETAGSGAFIELNGVTRSTNAGKLRLRPSGAATPIELIDGNGTIQISCNNAGTTINKVVLIANTPATATSTGTAGQIAWDSSGNLYLCYATNSWFKFTGVTF